MDRSNCKGCGAQIVWIRNENGRPEPFDLAERRVLLRCVLPQREDAVWLDEKKREWTIKMARLPHFITCPKRADFKRKPATRRLPPSPAL